MRAMHAVNPDGVCKTVFMGPIINGLACVPVNSTADAVDFEKGFNIQPTFLSLRNFLSEACPQYELLQGTADP